LKMFIWVKLDVTQIENLEKNLTLLIDMNEMKNHLIFQVHLINVIKITNLYLWPIKWFIKTIKSILYKMWWLKNVKRDTIKHHY